MNYNPENFKKYVSKQVHIFYNNSAGNPCDIVANITGCHKTLIIAEVDGTIEVPIPFVNIKYVDYVE